MSDDAAAARAALAPTGRLRAAINLGNGVLVQRDPSGGDPGGITVDLARELARRLDVPLDLVTFEQAGRVSDAVGDGVWDIGFLAVDPKRAAVIDFTAPYVLIEGAYLVDAKSRFEAVDEVDRDGVRIAVVTGSAYALYLERALKAAKMVQHAANAEALGALTHGTADVVANVRGPLERFASGKPEYRLLPGRFMAIEQAVALPKGRDAALAYVRAFVEDVKASGFVTDALRRSGQDTAGTVAPPAP